VNEAKDGSAVVIVEQAMRLAKDAAEVRNLLDESLAGLAVVMDVHLDVADALPRELGEGIEQFAAVLLLGIEEAVAGLLALGVARSGGGDAGPGLLPAGDATQGDVDRNAAAEGLVVVGNGNPEALGFFPPDQPSGAVAQVSGEPKLGVARKFHDGFLALTVYAESHGKSRTPR
jgi:hypothetical protein